MSAPRSLAWLIPACAAQLFGCVGSDDDPSQVHDLRVLGISLESPELMAADCSAAASALEFAAPVVFTALIADPRGDGRQLSFELLACASPADDRTCSVEADRVRLAEGTTGAGELTLTVRPGLAILSDGTPLLQRVWEQDSYRGLGGIRMPLVLRLRGGAEGVYAQKLMVFNCRRFASMRPNVNPRLPGLQLDGQGWDEREVRLLQGARKYQLQPDDFSALEEEYVVPSFELREVHLKESWKISWHTDLGKISPSQTGGVDLAGQESRQLVEWSPGASERRDVQFWVVVRDGRGGESWVMRRVTYLP
ncbi:MAG TPA: hypothetical protein VKE49_02125 [Myxococcaceae bacterium]|nr:hypothetical protein [Myxococcaceae bacterium]